MQELAPINIVCVCDNHYAILLAALIKSIESNHHTPEKLTFFVVEDGVSENNKRKITDWVNPDIITIHWLAMNDCVPKDIKLPMDKTNLPPNIYTRLFIPNFIEESIKKVIFLDVDMIMLEEISKLWTIDLEGKTVAAVQDQFIQVVSRWGGLANHEQLGIPADTKYFNSGLMVIDIDQWKKEDVTNRVIKSVSDHKEHSLFGDQYGLNVILNEQWKLLNPLWNRFAYSEEERPFLIHFTGRKPIYKSYEFSEKYKDIFYTYLRQTGWKNFKPIGETSRYLKKFNNLLEKFRNLVSAK